MVSSPSDWFVAYRKNTPDLPLPQAADFTETMLHYAGTCDQSNGGSYLSDSAIDTALWLC
jgi:hypothetical protein